MSVAAPAATVYPAAARGWWMVAVFCLAGLVSYTDRLTDQTVDAVTLLEPSASGLPLDWVSNSITQSRW